MNTKTKAEEQREETISRINLQLAVNLHQQLDLLRYRLINFNDLSEGVEQAVKTYLKNMKDNRK
mgnify:CR=1 FL=1